MTSHTTWILCGYLWHMPTLSRMYHAHACCEITNTKYRALEKEYSSISEQIYVKCHIRIIFSTEAYSKCKLRQKYTCLHPAIICFIPWFCLCLC